MEGDIRRIWRGGLFGSCVHLARRAYGKMVNGPSSHFYRAHQADAVYPRIDEFYTNNCSFYESSSLNNIPLSRSTVVFISTLGGLLMSMDA